MCKRRRTGIIISIPFIYPFTIIKQYFIYAFLLPVDEIPCTSICIDAPIENIPQEAFILQSSPTCKHCNAKRFYREPVGFCCSSGQVSLVSNDTPAELQLLFKSKSKNAFEFRKYVRTYNNTLAFTSFGVKYDRELCKIDKGIYTFKVQGEVYHYINDLVPIDGHPSCLQLYFYETDHEVENRIHASSKINLSIIQKLLNILSINPYCSFSRSLRHIPT